MEIGKINAGAWLTLQPVDSRVGEVKLRIMPIPSDFKFPEGQDVMTQLEAIGSFIVAWNLESEGVAIPCDEENKRRYLWHLIRLELQTEQPDRKEPLYMAEVIIKFAADIDNFLGN
jgi:hypothetical protein